MPSLFVLAALLGGAWLDTSSVVGTKGCDPQVRMEQLIFQSENTGQIEDESRHTRLTDQPSHLTYERAHGGIGP